MKPAFVQEQTAQCLLIGTLLCCGLLLLGKSFRNGREPIVGVARDGHKAPQPALIADTDWRHEGWQPLRIRMRTHRLFVSRLVVFSPQSGDIGWLDPTRAMADGIAMAWKLRYGFSIADSNLKNQDPDHDGFTNGEEYGAGTDPLDNEAYPPVWMKLHVAEMIRIPFSLQFKGVHHLADDQWQFQLNFTDQQRQRTRFVRCGEEIAGYRVAEYRQKKMVAEKGGGKLCGG